jgi:hypothetical protein
MTTTPSGQVDILGRKDSAFQNFIGNPEFQEMPEDDKQKVALTWQMFQKAKMWRAQWDKNWPRFWNEWEGNHFYGKMVHTLTRAVVNKVFSSCETFIGHVNDVLGFPETFARNPQNVDKAKLLTHWLKYEWQQANAGFEMEHVLRSAAVCGVGWAEIPWDEQLSHGKGDVAFEPVDEKFIFLSPYARNLKEALYLIDARNVPREYVERTWEKGKECPPGPWDGTLMNTRTYTGGVANGSDSFAQFRTTDDSRTAWTGSSSDQQGNKRSDMVTLVRNYIRQKDGKLRLLVVCNGIIMQDGPSPYDDEDYPYVQFNLIPTLDTYCGRSLVQFVEGLQEILDLSLSYLLDQQRYSSDPMLVVDIANAEEGNLIDNMPGAVLFDRSQSGGRGFNWMQAPGFNQSWLEVQKMITEYMDSVLGNADVLRGEHPPGIDTLGGLEIIRDEANVRIRNLIRWVRCSVKRSYLLMLSRLRQFATQERIIRIEEDGQQKFATVNPAVGATPEGAPVQDPTIPEDAEFDIEFGEEEAGGQQAKQERALALANTMAEDGLPMVTRAWVLDECGIKNAAEVMATIEQQKQAQAEAQAQQAQAASGGAPPEQTNPADIISSLFGGGSQAA